MRSRVTQQLSHILAGQPGQHAALLTLRAATPGKPPTPPPGFSPRDYAIFLLQVAAEIEHGLLLQYLFAAYSMGGPQVPATRRDDVRLWQTLLFGIAKEEMGHFVTVQNILRLIGGPLNLERSDYPWDQPFYPFPFSLEPLTRKLVARYVCIESPAVWPQNWAHLKDEIETLAFGGSGGFNRVGVVYDTVMKLFADPSLMPDSVFQARTLSYQASFDEWGRGYSLGARGAVAPHAKTPNVLIGTAYSRQTALDALRAVAEQGEAADLASQAEETSHFERFMRLYEEFPGADAGWTATRPVASNPRAMGGEDPIAGTTYLTNAIARTWAQLFNLRYRMLLLYLAHSFRLSGAAGPSRGLNRGAVLNRVFGEMYNIRAIAGILVTLPSGDAGEPARAAPTFELPYTLTLPFAEQDVWRLHLDLLEGADALIHELGGTAGADGEAYLTSLQAIDAETAATARAVLGLAPWPDERKIATGGRP